jgi:hypothetical protein
MNEMVTGLPVDTAAALIGASPNELLAAITTGRIKVCIPITELLDFKASASLASSAVASGSINITVGPWVPISSISYKWPDRCVEIYTSAFQSATQINGRSHTVVIGFCERGSAGMADRARGVVFYNSPPKHRALVEFSGDGNLGSTKAYASVIKPSGGSSHLRPGDAVPSEYHGMHLDTFSSVVKGPNAPRSAAVVAAANNQATMLDIMARHGAIRGVNRGWL